MRWILVAAVLLGVAHAYADDVVMGAAVGAGGQGDANYGAVELRLDGEWHGIRIGLGGRAVWEGGAFRTREWSRALDAIAVVRQLEAHAGPVAIAAGALSPSVIGHVADGYRVALDDRVRTGVRVVLATRGLRTRHRSDASGHARSGRDDVAGVGDRGGVGGASDRGDASDHGDGDGASDRDDGGEPSVALDAVAEIDDVLDPALIGGALAFQIAPAWGVRAATAVDPATNRVAIEVGAARRWERDEYRVDLGASIVGERWVSGAPDSPPSDTMGTSRVGLGAIGYASAAIDRAGSRWTIAADVRAGNGTNGAAFGPLYRAERTAIVDPGAGAVKSRAILDGADAGIGAGLAAGVSSDRGWLSIGGRYRPGLGALGTFTAGAPMGSRLQAGAWLATSPRATAGAAEVRAVWATHFYTSLQMARMYIDADAMDASTSPLTPAWSATVWFGASTR